MFTDLSYGEDTPIEEVYPGEDIYQGDQTENAPNLVLLGAEGVRLEATMNDLEGPPWRPEKTFGGKHTYPDAIFIQNRPISDTAPPQLQAEDVLNMTGLDNEEDQVKQRLEALGYI